MANISLTTFVDFVAATGSSKARIVRVARQQQEEYDPRFDFYRQLRRGIREFHFSKQVDKHLLDGIYEDLENERKRKNYAARIASYKTFLGRKVISSFPVARSEWRHAGLTVRVNPELGLLINGNSGVVKLYFKAKELSSDRVQTACFLMKYMLRQHHPTQTFSVLDVCQGKLLTGSQSGPDLLAVLEGEALCFMSIYNSIV